VKGAHHIADLKRCAELVEDVVVKVNEKLRRQDLDAVRSDFESRMLNWKELDPHKMSFGRLLLFDALGFINPIYGNTINQACFTISIARRANLVKS